MPAIFQADCYCDECAVKIKERLRAQAAENARQSFQNWNVNTVDAVARAFSEFGYEDFSDAEGFWEYIAVETNRLPDFEGAEDGWDSDDFPKYMSEDEESDSPIHCGSAGDCCNAVELPSGRFIGALLSTNLTGDGIDYVKEIDAGEVKDFWLREFEAAGIDFDLDEEEEE